ncbi:MAG: J domain-containing protein [Deltaproteobacteria bacterium]|nr:J domain-containing protein [Deltaproteobacteria bacterium]
MTYKELKKALQLFDIASRASLAEIKSKHKSLVKKYHPDKGCNDPKKIQQINAAYQILLTYCSNYRFAFDRNEFMQQCPEERLREQFSNDTFWGKENKSSAHDE